MSIIRVLDDALINQIAAGEVVERPANAVKELIENALDAGAKRVTVEIKDGGTALIRVSDDGRGIAPDQLRAAFTRHATSKISDLNGLQNVATMGFRGEALASIAGVASVTLISKSRDERGGAIIETEGGAVKREGAYGCPDGTTVTVRDLFFNTPARLKFLRSTAAEAANVAETAARAALSRPDVSFAYINNGAAIWRTNGGGMSEAVRVIYGGECMPHIIAVNGQSGDFGLSGVVFRPEFNRSNRRLCNVFVNNRPVRSTALQSAIEDGYVSRLLGGRFPAFALNLTVPPDTVDVNVHPAKLEVRFADEAAVKSFVRDTVTKALTERRAAVTQVTFAAKTAKAAEQTAVYKGDQTGFLVVAEPRERYASAATDALPDVSYISLDKYVEIEDEQPVGVIEQGKEYGKETGEEEPFGEYIVVGQIFASYWLVERRGALYIIDQHAAHERILFERFMNIRENDGERRQLTMPIPVELSPTEAAAYEDNAEALERLGFEVERFGGRTYAVRAVPDAFAGDNIGHFVEVLDELANGGGGVAPSVYDKVATAACKAAIKANDKTTRAEARALIDKLLTMGNPFNCPHGRPTIVEITKRDIEKMFLRT